MRAKLGRDGEDRDRARGGGGEQDDLERKLRGENRNEAAPYKPCFLLKTGQLEDLGMQAAVPRGLGTRDAGNVTCLQPSHCPLPPAQQGSTLHFNQCPTAISLHHARPVKGDASLAK